MTKDEKLFNSQGKAYPQSFLCFSSVNMNAGIHLEKSKEKQQEIKEWF